jgi:hypothetical protein
MEEQRMAYLGPAAYPSPGLYPVSPVDGTSGDYAPSLTGYIDRNPCARVRVAFNSLPPNCVSITVWRQATGRQLPVRGGINLAVAVGVALIDPEAPSGVPALYVAQMFDIDGVFIGTTGTAQITLRSPDTWVQNPFDPSGAITCRVGIDTGRTVTLGATLSAVYPAGRRAGIGIGGQRFGIPNVPVHLYGDTIEQAEALDDMFGTRNGDLGLPPFLVVRFSAKLAKRLMLPQPLILGVSAPTRTLINAAGGGQKPGWDVSGPELDPPAAALAEAIYSRDDMDAGFVSRDARDSAYTSRLAMDTDYNRAGAAGDGSPDAGTGSDDPPEYGAGSYGSGAYGQ